MNLRNQVSILMGISCAAATTFAQLLLATEARIPTAPPTPPAILETESGRVSAAGELRATAQLYSIGDPTPEEQLYVEMINRARANPQAEAELFATTTDPNVLLSYHFYGVDLALMQSQFASIAPAPPVAPNPLLTEAARRHSGDMLTNSFQSHTGSDGSTFRDRIEDTGYNFRTIAENIYATAESVFHGHAGFEVDWGPGPGGMQTPAGHRTTIHSAAFREVGVGVVLGENTPPSSGGVAGAIAVGPSLVSQEFGSRHGDTPLITGVVYFDLNGNNFYDLGEGVGGVNVSVSGTTIQAVTARSGGYAVPVAGDGNYTVTFSAEGVPAFSQAVTISSLQNTKVDFRPVYSAPTLSGPESPAIDQPNSYTISPVPAAAGYQWRHFQLTTPVIEGAETGPSAVTASTFGAYELFDTAIKQSGGHSFHLMTPTGNIREQSFILNGRYLVNEGTILRFQSRLRLTTSTTFAIVQVSTNSGQSWHEVYRQAGATGSPGEASFQPRAANLSQYAGSILQVRFSFLPTGSSYIDADTGWFIDDIVVDGSSQIINQQLSQEIGTPGFQFQPTTEGNFVLQARGRTGHDYLPWGPMLHVQAVQGTGTPPTVQMSVISVENGRVIIEAEVEAGDVPSTWALESKDNLNEAWTTATTNFELVSPTRVRFDLLARAADKQQFYRVVTTQ